MKSLSLEPRQRALHSLQSETLDVLIIGGGIVGAGVARDAAMRGLKTGLVEQHDFAFGTSSRSSRLLHGGLRYLAQGRLGLVHEASVEKKIIHHIAPHLAEPLPFIFPAYRGNQTWVLWQLKIGVKIYDLLCGGRNLGKSTWLNTDEVMCKVPSLSADGLNGAVRYYDGFTNDARLTLDTLRSAAKHGARLANCCRFKNAKRVDVQTQPLTPSLSPSDTESMAEGRMRGNPQPTGMIAGEFWDCEVEDVLTRKTLPVQARNIVNATGPWADGLPHSRVKLRLTKGIHLVVERTKVPVPETVAMTEGKRILFAIPWGGRTILGTTDTDYHGSLDDVTADASDLNYVLQITNQFFPDAKLTAADVISSWAGLRPLLADPNGKPSDISRSHEITNPEPGWWDVAGGKLTTYRLMAEQAVDQIVKKLASPNHFKDCCTATEPLLPVVETENVSGIVPPEFTRGVVEHYVANEWAIHLDDVMVRRTSWHYYFPDAAEKAGHVADWMGGLLGWSQVQHAAELQRYRAAVTGQSVRNATELTPRRELTNR